MHIANIFNSTLYKQKSVGKSQTLFLIFTLLKTKYNLLIYLHFPGCFLALKQKEIKIGYSLRHFNYFIGIKLTSAQTKAKLK